MRALRDIVGSYDEGTLSTTDALAELEEHARLPLSEGQRGLWALHKMAPDTYSYNVPVCLRCDDVDRAALEEAFRDTASTHPILTATVQEGADGPYLALGSADRMRVDHADISGVAPDAVLDHLTTLARRPFDLAGEPLIRLSVLSRAEAETYVLVVVHHLIFDGPSLSRVLDTLLHAYQARLDGGVPSARPDGVGFGEFVAWEKDFLAGERAERDREYWRRELAGRVPLTGLPTETTLAPDAPHVGEVCTRRLSKAQVEAVTSGAAANGVLPSVFLLAVLKTLLHRYTGQEDLVVGMPVSTRPSGRFDDTVGYFINALPIRSRPVASEEFTRFAERLQETVFEAIDHGAYPFHRMVREFGDRDDPRSPVFQVAYNYQNFSLSEHLRDTGPFEVVDGLHQVGDFDLALHVLPGERFELQWKYHPDAFSADTIARMADHFVNLVEAITASDGRTALGRLTLLGEAERRLVLDEWNRTDVEYPEDRTVWDLFAEQAAANPDRPAMTCGDRTLTYRELGERSSALADALGRRGVGAGDRVGVCFERSLDLITCLLAVMKQGAAYVPLDPGFPAQRLSYMIQDSGATLVVCHEAVVDRLSTVDTHGARLHVIDRPDDNGDAVPEPRATRPAVAHLIYTSGSTGKPKGVVIPHRALTNFLLAMARMLDVTADDRMLAIATYSFDIAGLELYLPLITGGRCRISDSATAKDATLLATEIEAWRPTILQATPTTWAMLVRVGWRNACDATLLTGGEALPENLKDQLMARGEVWNLYGPTETTIYTSGRRLRAGEPLSVGLPMANTRYYVLDKNLQPLPVGVPGEVCIAGHCLALGYHGQPELTAERFVDNPFVPGELMYRSGDVARRLPNGELAILGRMDNQVKLRGYRIELGEIETTLNEHPQVAQSVVVVEHNGSSKRLAAYFNASGNAPDTKELRAHLEKSLPAYMVPSAFVALDSFPLTANGKIDRARLDAPSEPEPAPDVEPRHVERTVRGIFGEVLGKDTVEADEGFFDAGGDSFTAIEVVQRINSAFGCQLRPTTLFLNPSIAAMVRHVEGLRTRTPPAAPQEPVQHHDPAPDRDYLDDSIAVVGLSCQFPGAKDHREFWRNLRDGRGASTVWTPEELRALGVPDELTGRAGYVPLRSVVEAKAEFDPAFFGISPRDAELMDPQGRLLLLHGWKALEDAGYRPEDVPNTSVFTSTSNNFYQALLRNLMETAAGTRILADTDGYAAWLFAQGGSVPTMISSKLGLRGPSMAVSTNCSSALTGVHLACQGLLAGEVDQALVGAASLGSLMELGYVHQPGLNFSSDGRCRAFDDAADGMTGGEGVGVVVLKRASAALADGDHVYCLIRGVAVNNDGGAKAGYYAPSAQGQTEVVRMALDKAGVDPESISYVEAHGTGTKLGDPIEIAALTEAYRHYTSASRYCGIGSVKSNIGHLDAAAGIAGLIKMALSLRHGEIPRTLHCDVPNTEIEWDSSPFYVATRNVPLRARPARVGLSAFGIGGTNAHAVLEQADQRAARPVAGPHLVVLSARDDERLAALARELLAFLPDYRGEGGDLARLAYTLQTGRRAMASRVAFVADDLDRLTAQLGAYVDGRVPDEVFAGSARRDDDLVSLFTRTGELKELTAQWAERGAWDKLAPLWVSGIDVDWRGYYGTQSPERVSLPTYPFALQRFWPSPQPTRTERRVHSDDLLAAEAGAEGVDRFLARRRHTTTELNGALRRLLLAQLWSAGLVQGDSIRPEYAKWLDHSVTVLVDGGELVRDGDVLRPRDGVPDAEGAWREWREWTDAHAGDPEIAAKTTMVERVLRAMPAILTGQSTATTVLFPGGSFEFVEAVYNGNFAADYFHRVLADLVRGEVAERPGTRILEVGGGTGSATRWVLEKLDGGEIAEYCFTDISKAFLIEAEKRFSPRRDYLKYRVFDVERAPGEQGLDAGQYDIVIANNVLHTTKDVGESVEHAKALLRPGGVLLLNEVVDNDWWAHLALGLLDGWFRYTDGRRLVGGPALSAASWRAVLRERGFHSVRFPTEQAQELGLQLIVARAPVSTPIPAEPGTSLETDVEAALTRSLMASLKLRRDELRVDAPFADYGLDSLTGVNLVRMLNESLGTDLDPSVLFDNPSIRRLTAFILDEHGDELTGPREAPVIEAAPGGKEPIAIIGMSGRFPGARDVDEFWSQLVEGRDPVTPVSRWDLSGQSRCGHGGFLDGIDEFDPLFFGISGAEAGYMEPQQRLFLQEAWHALEDAGHAGGSFDRERCGIYVGCGDGDYFDLTTPTDYPAQAFWGNMNSMVPARLAYYLDLHGPAMTVNTACSSSLVSLYLACQGLWAGETDLALAGGVAVQCSPKVYLAGSRAGMLAPSGRCRSFDQDADGFVPAEAVGVVVLKRLADAESDGDHIYGVVRGIGVNQDGTSNGITAPNGNSQEKLIRRIYRDFDIDPEGIHLVEAHGTGTKLGDPVEVKALTRAFRAATGKVGFCSLGSVKANIGHAGEAAGIAGVIKTLLAMKHGVMPGLLHYRNANASIALEDSPFFVHTEPKEWTVPAGGRRRAAITSLGASGTNVHAVIEQAPAAPRRNTPGGPRLIALSAGTSEALRDQLTRLARHCARHRDLDLGDLSYTLLLGRKHVQHRWACVASDLAELVSKLSGEGDSAGTSRMHVLAAQYLDGQTPDFAELFRDGRYRRVSLPGYPFERTRYTIPGDATLTGDEFYLRAHQVRGTAIVPGAMYLQWAYVAAPRADAVCLHDVTFLRPLGVADGARTVRVDLHREDGRFEVRSTANGDSTTHCQGRISALDQPARPVLDLPALRRDFRPAVDPNRFYAEYGEHGIDYGPELQGCVALYEAEGAVLAELKVPDAVAGTAGDFALHPALVDSAMQCMRLLTGAENGLVFSIKKVEVLGPCPPRMWAWVRRADDTRGRIDIDLADADGTVCLTLRGITGRRTESESPAVTLLPTWDPDREARTEAWPRSSESVGIIAATPGARDLLTARFPSAHVLTVDSLDTVPRLDHLIWMAPEHTEASGEAVIDGQTAGTLQVFRTVKALLAAGYGNRPLGLTLLTRRAHAMHESEPIDPTHAGVAGLAGSVAKEYPNWTMRVADLDAYDTPSLSAVLSLPPDRDGDLRIHRNSTWYRQQLLTVRTSPPTSSGLREGGTYVIVGGAGGLGTAITAYLIRRYGAQVVWLGRRPRDVRIDAGIDAAIAAAPDGPAPHYVQADATNAESLRQARDEIERRFGTVHGVIHSGLVFSGGASMTKMTEQDFHDVVRSKVDASVRLLEVFGGESLEVAIFLSSIISYLKSLKQADYAAACTFMDSFARTVQTAKVLNLGYCFNNPADDTVPLIQPDELTAAVEVLCAGTTNQLTLMKFSPAFNTRGITVGDDEVFLRWEQPPPPRTAQRDPFDDLALLRERVTDLTALTI